MLIPLGFWAASAGGGAGAGSFDLLETQVLASSAASVSFTSLSTYAADYQHLQIRFTARTTQAVVASDLRMRLNGVTSASYSRHLLYGNGSTVASSGLASQTFMNLVNIPGSSATADAYCAGVIDLLDPFDTTKNTTMRALAGNVTSGDNLIALASGAYLSTDAITSATLINLSGDLAIGSRFSLYGIRGG